MFAFLMFNSKKKLDRDIIIATVRKHLSGVDIMACNSDLCQVTYNETEMSFDDMLARHYLVPDDNWYLSSYMKVLNDLGVSDTGVIVLYTLKGQRFLNTSKTVVFNTNRTESKKILRDLRTNQNVVSASCIDLSGSNCHISADYNDYMLRNITEKDEYNNYVDTFNKVLSRNM